MILTSMETDKGTHERRVVYVKRIVEGCLPQMTRSLMDICRREGTSFRKKGIHVLSWHLQLVRVDGDWMI